MVSLEKKQEELSELEMYLDNLTEKGIHPTDSMFLGAKHAYNTVFNEIRKLKQQEEKEASEVDPITKMDQERFDEISDDITEEYLREGDLGPDIQWTGNVRVKDGKRWYETKITDEETKTYVIGWTDGGVTDYFINFIEE